MKTLFSFFFLLGFSLTAHPDQTVTNYQKVIPGVGKMLYMMSYFSNKLESGGITATRLTLALDRDTELRDVLYQRVPPPDKTAHKSSPLPSFEDYKYSQVIDFVFEEEKCSFLFSFPSDLRFLRLQKTGEKWSEKQLVLIKGITSNQKITSISLKGHTTIHIKREDGLDVYEIPPNGAVTKNGKIYENKRPDEHVITVP